LIAEYSVVTWFNAENGIITFGVKCLMHNDVCLDVDEL